MNIRYYLCNENSQYLRKTLYEMENTRDTADDDYDEDDDGYWYEEIEVAPDVKHIIYEVNSQAVERYLGKDVLDQIERYEKLNQVTDVQMGLLIYFGSALTNGEEYSDIDPYSGKYKICLLYYDDNRHTKIKQAEFMVPSFIDQLYIPHIQIDVASEKVILQQIKPVDIYLFQALNQRSINWRQQTVSDRFRDYRLYKWFDTDRYQEADMTELQIGAIYGYEFKCVNGQQVKLPDSILSGKKNGRFLFRDCALKMSDFGYGIDFENQDLQNIKDGTCMLQHCGIDGRSLEAVTNEYGTVEKVLDIDKLRFKELEQAEEMFYHTYCADGSQKENYKIHWDMSKLTKLTNINKCLSDMGGIGMLDINFGDISRFEDNFKDVCERTRTREMKISGTHCRLAWILDQALCLQDNWMLKILDLQDLYVDSVDQHCIDGSIWDDKGDLVIYISKSHGFDSEFVDRLRSLAKDGAIKAWYYIEDVKDTEEYKAFRKQIKEIDL